MAKRSDPKREAFWRRVLRRRAKSGMTVAEFCVSENLTESAFYYWQRQIRRREAGSQAEQTESAGVPAFHQNKQFRDVRVTASAVSNLCLRGRGGRFRRRARSMRYTWSG